VEAPSSYFAKLELRLLVPSQEIGNQRKSNKQLLTSSLFQHFNRPLISQAGLGLQPRPERFDAAEICVSCEKP